MTLKITNEEQAQERKEYLDKMEWCLNFERKQPYVGSIEENRAALAAYEQRKAMSVVLTEDELTLLKCTLLSESFMAGLFSSLQGKKLLDDCTYGQSGRNVTFPNVTDLGRAYLAAQKPRELKWEVGNGDTPRFIASCDDERDATVILNALGKYFPDGRYIVREVQ